MTDNKNLNQNESTIQGNQPGKQGGQIGNEEQSKGGRASEESTEDRASEDITATGDITGSDNS